MSHDDDDDDSMWDDDEEPPVVACPFCREPMLEDAPRCPACGNYVSDEDRSAANKPSGLVVFVVIGLILALAWAAFR